MSHNPARVMANGEWWMAKQAKQAKRPSGFRRLSPAVLVALLLALLTIIAPAVTVAAQPAPDGAADIEATEGELTFDRWYVLRMEGDRVGHAHLATRETDERIITFSDTQISIRRGAVTLRITQSTRFAETPDGEPIEVQSRLKMGQMAVHKTMRFDEDEHVLITEQGGRTMRQTIEPSEQAWLPPAAAQRYIEQRMREDAQQIEVHTLDVTTSTEPFKMTLQVLGEEQVEVMGKVVPATAWEATLSTMPNMSVREYVDDQGQTLKTTMQVMPGMEIEMLAADEQLATAEVDPPELMASMLIEPAGTIENPRGLRSAVYELRLKEGIDREQFDLPRTGYQRVVWGDQRTARVVVDLDRPVAAGEDLPGETHREASSMLDHEDPEVRALLSEALGEDADQLDDATRAERLRAFVQQYVEEKDLSVGAATASEVARTQQGDCTEHAVLLAALLRAADIPSRTATGLLYVDQFLGQANVFGGHMWTQAWLPAQAGGGRTWIDLDPTLPAHAYDATHITLATSAMSDSASTNALVKQASLLSALEIKIVSPTQ